MKKIIYTHFEIVRCIAKDTAQPHQRQYGKSSQFTVSTFLIVGGNRSTWLSLHVIVADTSLQRESNPRS